MHHESVRLKGRVHALWAQYEHADDATASINRAADRDQRFIRLQETEILSFPGYDYEGIEIVKYNAYPFMELMKLWKLCNLLRGCISANIEAARMDNHWLIDEQLFTLAFRAKDDIGHTETHSAHLQTRFNAIAGTIRR